MYYTYMSLIHTIVTSCKTREQVVNFCTLNKLSFKIFV